MNNGFLNSKVADPQAKMKQSTIKSEEIIFFCINQHIANEILLDTINVEVAT